MIIIFFKKNVNQKSFCPSVRSQEVIGNVTPKFEILMSQRNALHGKKIFFESGKIHFILWKSYSRLYIAIYVAIYVESNMKGIVNH